MKLLVQIAGSARHISGVSIYGVMSLCSTDLQRNWSPKRCRYIAAISSKFCVPTKVTIVYNYRCVEHFLQIQSLRAIIGFVKM
jgi:hypothetical protein